MTCVTDVTHIEWCIGHSLKEKSMKRSTISRLTVLGAAAAAAVTLVPSAAHAATNVGIDYDAVGTTHMASTNNNIPLGPTTLHTVIDVDTFNLSGSMALPTQHTTFTVLGFVPVEADVSFIQAAPLTGHIDFSGANAVVTSNSSYTVKLSNVKMGGLPGLVGSNCQTKSPVTISANTPAGEGFDLLGGGNLKGSFSLGDFKNCGINTWLINQIVPGSGNTVSIKVSNGVQVF
jgi:hypothetical protein